MMTRFWKLIVMDEVTGEKFDVAGMRFISATDGALAVLFPVVLGWRSRWLP